MKIWFQVVSSPSRLPNFLAELQKQVDKAAGIGTEVVVKPTRNGALADNFASLLHFDADEILRTAIRDFEQQGFGIYAMANSVDPCVDGLRELLDVPVLSLLQVGCSVATMLGNRFGLVVPNFKFVPMYEDLVQGYGLGSRLAGAHPLQFDRIADHDKVFVDVAAGDRAIEHVDEVALSLVRNGAECILVAGPMSTLLHKRNIYELAGARVIDLYSALVKVSEAFGYLSSACGMKTSRVQKYAQPSLAVLSEAAELYGL